ncbi:SIS domain-containing protein [Candidatus Pelagibacter sp.]|nr:SIS domain-containing protein [Candidatus Pelagibacter sp.]
MKQIFYKNIFNEISNKLNQTDCASLEKIAKSLINKNKKNKKVIIFGNGGSAAISSHVSTDLTKNARIRSINFNEADLLTCFSNDFGYEKVFSKSLEFYADKGDIVIIISASGKSKNLLEAARFCKKNKILLYTFTGFSKSNPLKKMGNINLWVNSKAYNIIENIHQIWLLSIVDRIIGKTEYSA